MSKTIRAVAMSVLALSLTGGVAAAQSGNIGTTGPDSTNVVRHENRDTREVRNDNNVGVRNSNPQYAHTGRARTNHNTKAGDARSGDASNDSLLSASISISNNTEGALGGLNGNSSNSGAINTSGPDSYNKVVFKNSNKVEVRNNNNVDVENCNDQVATSGRASVSDNTEGGSARSGNASNISTNETTINISN